MQKHRTATIVALALTAFTALALATPDRAHADKKALKLADNGGGQLRFIAAGAGGMVAYSVRTPGQKTYQLYVINAGRGGRAKSLAGGVGAHFTPNGAEVVYYNDAKGDNLFWVTTITTEGKQEFDMGVQGKDPTSTRPAFSPDGKAIIYSDSTGSHIIPAEGEVTRKVSTTVVRDAQWSPDGKSVLYTRKGGGLSLMDIVTGRSKKLTRDLEGFNGRFSPDGSKILYAHDLNIYVMDAATGKRKLFIEGDRAEWTNNGQGMVVLKGTGKVSGSEIAPQPDMIIYHVSLAVDADNNFKHNKRLTQKAHEAVISPDGRNLYFSIIDRGLFKIRLDKLPGESEAGSRVKSVRASARVPSAAIPTTDSVPK